MKKKQHPATTSSAGVLVLVSLWLLLFRFLLRLRLAAVRDVALTLQFLARHRIHAVTVRLPGPDATTVRVWCPTTPSSKPPLLLLHGLGGDGKWTWAQNIPALCRSFHLYVPDLVFFGSCSHSASPLRSVPFQARCVADALRLLGVQRYHVAGMSYGGFVAYRMAAVEARDCVDRVVVMASGVVATAQELSALASREDTAVEDALLPTTAAGLRRLMCRSLHRPPWVPNFVLHDVVQLLFVDQRKEKSELLRELLNNGAAMDPLPVLTQQTLVLWGDKDQVFPVDLGYRLQRHLGDDCRLQIIKDAGHSLQDEAAGKVNSCISSFLLDAPNCSHPRT